MSPAPARLSDLQHTLLTWIAQRAGAPDEPVAFHLEPDPALPPSLRPHVSRSLRRLEARGLIRRLDASLHPGAARVAFVEITESGVEIVQRVTSRRDRRSSVGRLDTEAQSAIDVALYYQVKESDMPATATEMSTSEAARCLGIAAETLRSWARAGKIVFRVSPLGMIFDAEVVHRLAAARERAAREKGGRHGG